MKITESTVSKLKTELSPIKPKWILDDRQWFADNPSRSHRLRPVFQGEIDHLDFKIPADANWWVAIRQMMPGFRIRRFFHDLGNPEALLTVERQDIIAHAVFDLIGDSGYQQDGMADSQAIISRAKQISTLNTLH